MKIKYLHSDENILGGTVVIKGTRTPIETILYRVKDGYSIDRIHEMYDWIDRKTLEGAIQEALDVAIGALPSMVNRYHHA